MPNGGYPTAYRKEAGKYADRVRPNGTGSSKPFNPRGVGNSLLRRGFQTPLSDPFAPLETIPQERLKWSRPVIQTPATLAATEQAVAEAAALRYFSLLHPATRLAVAGYTLYRMMEKEIPAPELMAPGDPLPFNPAELGWVEAYSSVPYGEGWYDVGPSPTLYWRSPGSNPYLDTAAPNAIVNPELGTFPDGLKIASAPFAGITHIYSMVDTWTDSPFVPEPITRNNGAWYKPLYATDPLVRPDLWTGPTRIISYPVPYEVPGQEYYTGPRWNRATEAAYEIAPNPTANPVTDPPLYVGGTRPNTAVAIIRQPSIGVRPRPRIKPRKPRDLPRRHRAGRSKRYEREKKFIANISASGALGKLGNFVTEAVDAIDAVWDAIPDRLKTGYKYVKRPHFTTYEVYTPRGIEWHTAKSMPWDALMWSGEKGRAYNMEQYDWKQIQWVSPQDKAKDIWKHWKEIDYDQAFWNILMEQQNDQVYAAISPSNTKAGKEWLRRTGRAVGFETGPAM